MRAIKTITISILALGLLAGSAVGVAAQDAVVTETAGGVGSDDCETTPEGAEFCTGGRWEFDDPRLTGDEELTRTEVFDFGGGEVDGAIIATEDVRITNDDGAWSGQCVFGSFFLDDELVSGGNNCVVTGEGAYEGLTAYLNSPADGSRGYLGFILEAEPME